MTYHKQVPSKQAHHLRHPSPSIQGKRERTAAPPVSDSPHLSCLPALLFMMPQSESSRSDERKKTEVRETCTELSLLSSDVKGSVTSGFVLPSVRTYSFRWMPWSVGQARTPPEWPERNVLWSLLRGQSFLRALPGLSVLSLALLCPLHQFATILDLLGVHYGLSLCVLACVLCATAWGYLSPRAGSQVLIPWSVWPYRCMGRCWGSTSQELRIPG